MIPSALDLPYRPAKPPTGPRTQGITMVIDNGLPLGAFTDHVTSTAGLIDFVKFGWGTSVVSRTIEAKVALLVEHGIGYFFGGTLFEKHVLQDRFDDFRAWCHAFACRYVEVSNGTVALANDEKARYVEKLAGEFTVLSEVGLKDAARSEALSARDWVRFVREDLEAGARWVIAEARESGRSGICHADGRLRADVLDALLGAGISTDRLLFEAPTKDLQTSFIRRIGPNANLGNVAPGDVIGVETLRLGLRSDTLTTVSPTRPGGVHTAPMSPTQGVAAAPNF
ncbi:MAG TPA: phosphosulfolactate synthase [Actinomycetota bacterium]|nr:phosphosulfolactate synthase [Actinomycetota bacterium]